MSEKLSERDRDPEYAKNLRRAALASSLGSALEYYDFALYGLATALIFNELFFPAEWGLAATIGSFLTFAIGFVARPLGGLFFGTIGDRLGRKWVLMATIALMGGASTLIGVLPTYDQVGFWAPIMLVTLRILQGFGAGAEQAGSTVLMTEYAPRKRRGFFAALPFVGIMLGIILANGVFLQLNQVDRSVVLEWLWRVPFLVSIVLILVAVFIRSRLRESPTFIQLEKNEQVSEKPVREVFSKSWMPMLKGIALRMGEVGGSAMNQTFAVAFFVSQGLPQGSGSMAILIGSGIGVLLIPFTGMLSDRYGRLAIYRIGAILQVLTAIPAWWTFTLGNETLAVVMLALTFTFTVNWMLGAQNALLPELFGNRHRYLGVAMTREISAVIGGGVAPLLATWLVLQDATGNGLGLGWGAAAGYVIVLGLLSLLGTFVTRETRGRDLEAINDAENDSAEQLAETKAFWADSTKR